MIGKKTVSRVLELKGFTRERLEAEVRAAREKLAEEMDKLESLEQSHRTTCTDFTGRQTAGTLPVRELELYYAYLKHLVRQIEQQKKIIVIREREAAERQQALIQAYQEHRLVELLRDKLLRSESRQADRTEQKETDYAFIARKAER